MQYLRVFERGFLWFSSIKKKDLDFVLKEGLWFWRRVGLSTTPWFLAFDVIIMVVTKMMVWVRVHNLPFSFWHHQILEGIGKMMEKFLKMDQERIGEGTFTFSRLYVEICRF